MDLIPQDFKIHLPSYKVTKFNDMVEVLNNFQELLNFTDSLALPGTSFATLQNVIHSATSHSNINSEAFSTYSLNQTKKLCSLGNV